MHTLVQKGMTALSYAPHSLAACAVLHALCESFGVSAGCLAVLHMHDSRSADCDAAQPRVWHTTRNSLHISPSIQKTTSASRRPGYMSFGTAVQGVRGELSACRWSRGVLSVKGVKDMASKEWQVQLPFIALVSICSGLLGALFNALHKLLRRVGHSLSFQGCRAQTSCSGTIVAADCSSSQEYQGIAQT